MIKKLTYVIGMLAVFILGVGCGEDDDLVINKEPVLGGDVQHAVPENEEGYVIDTLTAEDEDEDLVFSILLNDNDRFVISPEGVLSLAPGVALDYEATKVHSIAVSVTDGELSRELGIVINVEDDLSDNVKASFDIFQDTTVLNEDALVTFYVVLDQANVQKGATVDVSIQSDAVYGEDYITYPAASGGVIQLPMLLAQDSVVFSVELINDLVVEESTAYTLSIVNGTDNIIVPASSGSRLTLTESNDDAQEVFFVSDFSSSGSSLYALNTFNGYEPVYLFDIALDGDSVLANIRSIKFDNDGQVMYAADDYANIFTIDLSTGAATHVTTIDTTAMGLTDHDQISASYGLFVQDGVIYTNVSFRDQSFNYLLAVASYDLNSGVVGTDTIELSTTDSPEIAALGSIGDQLYISNYWWFGSSDINDFHSWTPGSGEVSADPAFTAGPGAEAEVTMANHGISIGYGLYGIDQGYAILDDGPRYLVLLNNAGTFDFVSEVNLSAYMPLGNSSITVGNLGN